MIKTEKGKIGHLMMHICRMRGKMVDQFMEKNRLFRGQGMLLMFIWDHEGLTHSEIADYLKISPAATTKVVKRLEEEGYLQRKQDEKDERISRVFILPKGLAVIEDVHQSFLRLEEKTFQDFSKLDLENLGNYLERILTNLSQE
jgi:DNA-binding MarR family transcriptional regulator